MKILAINGSPKAKNLSCDSRDDNDRNTDRMHRGALRKTKEKRLDSIMKGGELLRAPLAITQRRKRKETSNSKY